MTPLLKSRIATTAPYLAALIVLLCTLWLVLPEPVAPSLAGAGGTASEVHPRVNLFFQAEDCDDGAATAAILESMARDNGFSFHVYLLDGPEQVREAQDRLADHGLVADVTPADQGTARLLQQLGHTRSPVVVVTDRSGSVRQLHPLPLQPEDVDRLRRSLAGTSLRR